VPSERGYVSGYVRPKPIDEQVAILRTYLPHLGGAFVKVTRFTSPKRAEGLFAFPRYEAIAPTYTEAVAVLINILETTLGGCFWNDLEGELGPDRLRQSERSRTKWQRLYNQQKGCDIVILPAQFGLEHRGRSARRSLAVMRENEFGLGLFENLAILLTHQEERLRSRDDLWIDCTGDEYSPRGDGEFERIPYICYRERLKLGSVGMNMAADNCGASSGFVFR
jgi:hypothetical protein